MERAYPYLAYHYQIVVQSSVLCTPGRSHQGIRSSLQLLRVCRGASRGHSRGPLPGRGPDGRRRAAAAISRSSHSCNKMLPFPVLLHKAPNYSVCSIMYNYVRFAPRERPPSKSANSRAAIDQTWGGWCSKLRPKKPEQLQEAEREGCARAPLVCVRACVCAQSFAADDAERGLLGKPRRRLTRMSLTEAMHGSRLESLFANAPSNIY